MHQLETVRYRRNIGRLWPAQIVQLRVEHLAAGVPLRAIDQVAVVERMDEPEPLQQAVRCAGPLGHEAIEFIDELLSLLIALGGVDQAFGIPLGDLLQLRVHGLHGGSVVARRVLTAGRWTPPRRHA